MSTFETTAKRAADAIVTGINDDTTFEKAIVVDFARPESVELFSTANEGDRIFNAPRPLVSSDVNGESIAWTGPFLKGVFYAVVTSDDDFGRERIAENKRQDAMEIFPVTAKQYTEGLKVYVGWLIERYGEENVDDLEHDALAEMFNGFMRDHAGIRVYTTYMAS